MSLAEKVPKWRFLTLHRHGFAVKFSPFMANRIACAAGENFGIKGNGYLFILEVNQNGSINLVNEFKWSDCLFDLTWSEQDPNAAVTCSGDGSLQLWNLKSFEGPLNIYREHLKEVYCVEWNPTRTIQGFLSASWDGTVKLWDCQHPVSLTTFSGHKTNVNYVTWAPLKPSTFSSIGGDACIWIWDVQSPQKPVMQIPTNTTEILGCDWCKYNENLLVTGSTDASVCVWDLRFTQQPIFHFREHKYAIRRVKFSPFHENVLASCSYDCTTRIWTIDKGTEYFKSFDCEVFAHHTEFVYGLDFNLLIPGQIVDCSWDQSIQIIHPASLPGPVMKPGNSLMTTR